MQQATIMPATKVDPIPDIRERIERVYRSQQSFFQSGATRPLAFRKEQLRKFIQAVDRYEGRFMEALHKDLRKSAFEAYGTEIGPLAAEARYALKHLRSWMQPVSVPTPLMFFPSTSRIIRDPLGVVLTIGPWNYPVLLLLSSVVSAIAGGNTVMVKPSELSVHTGKAIEELIRETFPEEYIATIQGPGPEVGEALIGHYHFDHILFTGSVPVGRKIMELAATQLSPVTLELGGKSPCIVDRQVDLDHAVRKIAWAKLINKGQTCVAPDYVLVHDDIKLEFIEKLKAAFESMLGRDPQEHPEYGRLINRKRFDQVRKYLAEGTIAYGGLADETDLYIAPTILTDLRLEDSVMQEEIFGPVLPVIGYQTHREVLEWIQQNPYPLALYLFTNSRETESFFMREVRFGGGCINNAVVHLGNPNLPFGGVGTSGMGAYHGKYGFETFTRPKSIVKSPTWFDSRFWYLPGRMPVKWLKELFKL